MSALFPGFFLGFSLILAIGAQNAFILKQGLKKEYVFPLCLVCALSDALLISVGVFGFNFIATLIPLFEKYTFYSGVLFLFFYGTKSFLAAFRNNQSLQAEGGAQSFTAAFFTCLTFTWLNPHVYLDTVVLLGSVSTQFPSQKHLFAIGSIAASFLFFFSLGYGARLLSPFFRQPFSWKILDFFIGIIMWFLAARLIHNYLPR